MEKKKLLIIGITMNSAGTEKSFLSFANCLDYDRYDVDLLLAKKEGAFLPLVPKEINIIEMPQYGDMFLLSAKNAASTILKTLAKKNPLVLFEVLPYFLKIILRPSTRSQTATRMWCHFLQKFPVYEKEYDAAVAYWGDRTMFYMIDKVKAKKKIAWLHFDYGHPKRDDELYLSYFMKCDKVVTVSKLVDEALVKQLPQLEGRTVMMENIQDPRRIWDLALRGETFPDPKYEGLRLLTVGRISEQKGFDFIPPVLKKLRDDGCELRWYIIGDGDEAAKNALIEASLAYGVADMLILLGTTINPYSYVRDCDIYVMTSRYEGKPITVEEAKILFKPIMVTNYLSASEQLDGGRLGEICEIGVDGIYEGLKRLIDSPHRRDELTEILAKEDFSNAYEMEKFEKMMSE